MTLPKPNRLTSSKDFASVYRCGSKAVAKHFILRALAVSQDNEVSGAGKQTDVLVSKSRLSRIGVSVSNKVSKRAVVRNQIKRRVKVAMMTLLPGFRNRYDVVISARPVAVECDYGEILRELEQLLNQLEVIDGYS